LNQDQDDRELKKVIRSDGLIEIILPTSVEVLDNDCFLGGTQLQSMTFEPNSG
jgi:hypothetical protein